MGKELQKWVLTYVNYILIGAYPCHCIFKNTCKMTVLSQLMTELNEEQTRVFDVFLAGHSLCLTGPAGTGKSYLIQHITDHCKKSAIPCAITALTGVSACLIGGQTLHSWGGIGLA